MLTIVLQWKINLLIFIYDKLEIDLLIFIFFQQILQVFFLVIIKLRFFLVDHVCIINALFTSTL